MGNPMKKLEPAIMGKGRKLDNPHEISRAAIELIHQAACHSPSTRKSEGLAKKYCPQPIKWTHFKQIEMKRQKTGTPRNRLFPQNPLYFSWEAIVSTKIINRVKRGNNEEIIWKDRIGS